jgi:hypothetical protein
LENATSSRNPGPCGKLASVIVVVEGPSAAGKTTWCRRHASRWLPEPGRWPIEEVYRYQVGRWRQAVKADEAGEVIMLDGDPFKLYYFWAQFQLGRITEASWHHRGELAERHRPSEATVRRRRRWARRRSHVRQPQRRSHAPEGD